VDVIVDEGHSGAVDIRPGLDRVRELAEAGAIDVVLAKKRNRFFRDRFLRMGYERKLERRGVRLMALDDAGHRVADALMDEFADWFREEVRQNTSAGRMQKAREGKLIGSHTPIFGFRFVRDAHGSIVGYEVDEENMDVVRTVIATVAEKGTVNGTRLALQRGNVPAPRGGFTWTITTIRRMVWNDAYYPHAYADLRPMLDAAGSTAPIYEGEEYGVVWYPKLKTTKGDPDPARGYARPRK
jgi:site-specific DNA recombinase